MKFLELLSPAKNLDIGIAAIDCGADAVYIAGPSFGARQAAGNPISDIQKLCEFAHKFGCRVFVTVNTIIYEHEIPEVYQLMLDVQEAGADALIVQDLALIRLALGGPDGTGQKVEIPLHASTQCAIRDADKALFLKDLGFSRLVLERELPLTAIKDIHEATGCEIEFFVHGALCVCYSGQCYMSEHIASRSANRGECIQACRSLYNLKTADGRTLVRNKALLSLKDYNLQDRLGDLAEAGVCSFKIEGRLKGLSYVKNVVRSYSEALDRFISLHPGEYARSSFGNATTSFIPNTDKTFNRGYTELFFDGKRGSWAGLQTPKAMGEVVGKVESIHRLNDFDIEITLSKPKHGGSHSLSNGDGFAFTLEDGSIVGFRGDICHGNTIQCRKVKGIKPGLALYRNISKDFEKSLDGKCTRLIPVAVNITFHKAKNGFILIADALSQDGRSVHLEENVGNEDATNKERMEQMTASQIGKSSGHYSFFVEGIRYSENLCSIPFCTSSQLNGIRRALASKLDSQPVRMTPMATAKPHLPEPHPYITGKKADYRFNIANSLAKDIYTKLGASETESAYELRHRPEAELMRTKYCIRYECGICPKHHKSKDKSPLYLENNGRKFPLEFDCANCEMIVTGTGK